MSSVSIYDYFSKLSITDLEELLNQAMTREESLFYGRILSLKMGLAQEKLIGENLL